MRSSSAPARPRDGSTSAECTVTPNAEPFRNPRNVLHWRADGTTPFPGSDHVISTPVVADIVPEGPDDVPSVEIAFMTWACPYQDATMPGVQWMRQGVLRVLSARPPYHSS